MAKQFDKRSRLRILQVCTADRMGGAERIPWSLFQAYRDRGHHSWLAVGRKYTDDSDVMVIPNQRNDVWFRSAKGLQERLRPLEAHVSGVWRVRQWLEAWSNPLMKIHRSLG